jgi:hypothetical protein
MNFVFRKVHELFETECKLLERYTLYLHEYSERVKENGVWPLYPHYLFEVTGVHFTNKLPYCDKKALICTQT